MPKKRQIKVINNKKYQQCTKCGKWLLTTEKNFRMHKARDVLRTICRECERVGGTEYRNQNKDKIRVYQKNYCATHIKEIKEYQEKNKEKMSEYQKNYYNKNKNRIDARHQNYYYKNRDKIRSKYNENREQITNRNRNTYNKNKEKFRTNSKNYYHKNKNKKVLFSIYANKLTIEESPKEDENGYLLVKCAYCGRYFTPKYAAVHCRIRSLKGTLLGENRLYCSDGCKNACPIYQQRKFPKGYKKASSREVNPLVRQMCLVRDNYKCQRCGVSIADVELHAHHIEGAVQQPMLANDIENTITLCKSCHEWVHLQKGCTRYDLRCSK